MEAAKTGEAEEVEEAKEAEKEEGSALILLFMFRGCGPLQEAHHAPAILALRRPFTAECVRACRCVMVSAAAALAAAGRVITSARLAAGLLPSGHRARPSAAR